MAQHIEAGLLRLRLSHQEIYPHLQAQVQEVQVHEVEVRLQEVQVRVQPLDLTKARAKTSRSIFTLYFSSAPEPA
jgi:hypothetical protein